MCIFDPPNIHEFQKLSVIVTFQALQMRKLPAPIMTRPPMNPKAMVSPRTRLAGKFSRPLSSSAKWLFNCYSFKRMIESTDLPVESGVSFEFSSTQKKGMMVP